ncbi:MAG TPA: hypothetical protein PK718_03005 [Candidatus Methanofastidiosa archaeon]|nr:hypothetical protein [Candidatus Methanofastidiosa archaeon]HPR41500.1 hypothetical protein [Candidatus Methanofastidiosa archaeon]
MNDIISALVELKGHARIAQELMLSSEFEGTDWKKLTVALESIYKINRILDEIMNSVETDERVHEKIEQIKKYHKAPYVPDFMSDIWDESNNCASEEAL